MQSRVPVIRLTIQVDGVVDKQLGNVHALLGLLGPVDGAVESVASARVTSVHVQVAFEEHLHYFDVSISGRKHER